jgi:hypothetical protein
MRGRSTTFRLDCRLMEQTDQMPTLLREARDKSVGATGANVDLSPDTLKTLAACIYLKLQRPDHVGAAKKSQRPGLVRLKISA